MSLLLSVLKTTEYFLRLCTVPVNSGGSVVVSFVTVVGIKKLIEMLAGSIEV